VPPSVTLSDCGADRLGFVASSLTVIAICAVACADVLISVSVAVTVRMMLWVDSPVVSVSPSSCVAVSVHVPL